MAFTQKLNSSSAFVYFRWSWSCYFGLGLGLVSSGLGLGLVTLVLVLRIWSCLHHWCFRARTQVPLSPSSIIRRATSLHFLTSSGGQNQIAIRFKPRFQAFWGFRVNNGDLMTQKASILFDLVYVFRYSVRRHCAL